MPDRSAGAPGRSTASLAVSARIAAPGHREIRWVLQPAKRSRPARAAKRGRWAVMGPISGAKLDFFRAPADFSALNRFWAADFTHPPPTREGKAKGPHGSIYRRQFR